MTNTTENRVFGKTRQPYVLILANGDKVRHLTVRPWLAATALCVAGLLSVGYIGSTAYLVLRDDIIGATMARQARIQHDYEDRISALRAQVDRVTSRQLIDQQVVERKVEKLLAKQAALTSRHGRLDDAVERAANSGLVLPETEKSISNAIMPEKRAALSGAASAIDKLIKPTTDKTTPQNTTSFQPVKDTAMNRADDVLSKVNLSLRGIEDEQMTRIAALTAGAANKAAAMADIMRSTGVKLDAKHEYGVGGPFVEPLKYGADPFDASLNNLDNALDRLDAIRNTAEALPFGNPAPGRGISSRFGNRLDPFLGRLALHAGVDFQAETGADVHSTGAGTVSFAGNSGGYGNMVEVDHGQGITTRYGHMSEILVKPGDNVNLGDVLGKAGSTGRSTGPHVHYEVRLNDIPVDPMRFLVAGSELKTYLE